MTSAKQPTVRIYPYVENPLDAYMAADLVIARAGASTLAELAVLGKPALLIPYPFATADHQRRNAEAVVATGAAAMLLDAQLAQGELLGSLDALLTPHRLHALSSAAQNGMARDAGMAILDRVHQYISEQGG